MLRVATCKISCEAPNLWESDVVRLASYRESIVFRRLVWQACLSLANTFTLLRALRTLGLLCLRYDVDKTVIGSYVAKIGTLTVTIVVKFAVGIHSIRYKCRKHWVQRICYKLSNHSSNADRLTA